MAAFKLYDLKERFLDDATDCQVIRMVTSKEYETLCWIGHVTVERLKIEIRKVPA